jgi:hypothetical protein
LCVDNLFFVVSWEEMTSDDDDDAMTHLAMPERAIPVLVPSSLDKANGVAPLSQWALRGIGAPAVAVRRFKLASLKDWNDPRRRSDLEKEFGPIKKAEWSRIPSLIDLCGRWNDGDRREVIETDPDCVAGYETEFPGKFLIYTDGMFSGWMGRAGSLSMPAELALMAKFTAGLSRVRFVVWQDNLTRKFAPGLFCPDVMCAAYAAVLYGLGTPGGVAVCRRCKKTFLRSRGETQHYCDHKCRDAAAHQRFRANHPEKAKSRSKSTTKSTKGK